MTDVTKYGILKNDRWQDTVWLWLERYHKLRQNVNHKIWHFDRFHQIWYNPKIWHHKTPCK